MANNGKGIGPRGLGALKSMAKYGSMAKQTEPKTGKNQETPVIESINSENTNADIYTIPAISGAFGQEERFTFVQDRRPDSKPRYTKEELSKRVDPKTNEALDYNLTSGTVETIGSSKPNDPRPYKNINLNNTSSVDPMSTSKAKALKANTATQIHVTNREYDTNKWNATTKRKNPELTKSSPQITYDNQIRQFDTTRFRDSIRTMNDRKFAALNTKLEAEDKRLSNSYSKDDLKKYLNNNKR